jgi:glycosyltransferase involved in cell wall biosynthesis
VSYRVLHVTSSFPRHRDDAVAPFLLDLARAQAADGMRVTVVAPHDEGLAMREVIDDVEIVRARYAPDRAERLAYRGGLLANVRDPRRAALVPALVATLASAVRKVDRAQRPDVVHAHWWLPAGLAALTAHAPLVVTLHGSDVALARHRAIAPLARAVTSRAAFVSAVSEPLLAEARGVLTLDPARSGVVRMPVVIDTTRPATAPPAGPPWRLVAVGRASREKGFDVLLEALAIARAQGLDATVDIVGDGPERAALSAQRDRLGLGAVVAFVDALPRHDLHERIMAAHALVVPSRHEGLGLVAVEALALRRPVIASRTGGLVEVVTPGSGVLVPPDDAPALAAALRGLPLADPPYPAPAVRMHDLAAVVAAHREVYERAVATS